MGGEGEVEWGWRSGVVGMGGVGEGGWKVEERRKAGLVGAGGVGEGEVWKWRRTGGGGEGGGGVCEGVWKVEEWREVKARSWRSGLEGMRSEGEDGRGNESGDENWR